LRSLRRATSNWRRTMIQETVNKEVSSKIEEMFQSRDLEMNRLGQKLCHQYRIDYYIATIRESYLGLNGRKLRIPRSHWIMSTQLIEINIGIGGDLMITHFDKWSKAHNMYKIRLCRH
jgi:hypothetical protein